MFLNLFLNDYRVITSKIADSIKFGRRGFGRICGLELIDEIITDKDISAFTLQKKALEDYGIKVPVV